ncbi:polymorphic toxin-type HINT domain-containing protein [Actinoplanes sp. NBC_00393]|uniref:polymorphic toxin-type HINT domain-containing protein n=1 Tax=Actinoplanes sp. NBC_00393 TaxID=2975953 RepID=UPI002E1D0D03
MTNLVRARIRVWVAASLIAAVFGAGLHAPPALAEPTPAPTVAATEDPGPAIEIPALVTESWNGATGVDAMAERWRKAVADIAALTPEPEVRDAALAALATGDPAVIQKFAITDKPALDKQIAARKKQEAADNLTKIKAMKGTGGPYFNAEVDRVLAGTDFDRAGFLAYGADIARDRDKKVEEDAAARAATLRERVRLIAAMAPAESHLKRAAEAAFAGDGAAIEAFLTSGYLTAARADAAEREQYLKDLEARNKAAEELTELAQKSARASAARQRLLAAHGNGVRALQQASNAMAAAANSARHSARVLAGSGTAAAKATELAAANAESKRQLGYAQAAAQEAAIAAQTASTSADELIAIGLEYGAEWSLIAQGMSEAATAAVGATQTAVYASDATVATNNAQGAQAQAEAHAQQAIKWRQHAEEHAKSAAKLAAAAAKQAQAAKTAAARAKTAREQAQAAERKALAEAEKTRQHRQTAEARAAEAKQHRQTAEAERDNAANHRAEAERQGNIARTARADAEAQAAAAKQARSKAESADDAAAVAENRAWQNEEAARKARDEAMAAERAEQTAKAKAAALRAAAASAETEADKQEAQREADAAEREAAAAGTAARAARSAANTATGAAANARAAATQSQQAADRAWAAAEKARAAAAAADAAADKAEASARATHAARVRADAKAAEATAQQSKAAAAANAAQTLAGQAAEEAVRSLWAADRTKAESEAATTEAVAASAQAETAVAASQAAATSAAGIAEPANTAIGMVSPFTGADIDADFVRLVAEQALTIGAEQAAAARARATEAITAAERAAAAAATAAEQVKPAYTAAAAAARSAADAAVSAAEARQSAAQAAADAAAARAAAANAAKADAQARADAGAARQSANEAASDAAIAGRSAQQAQNEADQADKAADDAEADARAARQAADKAEADAAGARKAADSAQNHADGAADAAKNALQAAIDAQKAADQAEEAERQRQANAVADAAAELPLDPADPELLKYLTPEEIEQLRLAEQEAGMSVLDFIKAEAADLFWELSGVGDIVSCIRDGNIEACLWSLAGMLGAIKAVRAGYKIVKLIPKLLKFLDKVKDAKKRREALLELAKRRKKLKDDDEEPCDASAKANSFLPGTRVLLADGGTRAIEELSIGDSVLATDPVTGVTVAKPVTDTITGAGKKRLVDITVDTDGERGDRTATITATHNHPFWIPAVSEWFEAEDLAAGQLLRDRDGRNVRITAIRQRDAMARVHNLTVADIHTFYVVVAGTSVLVHNDSLPCICKKSRDKRYKYESLKNNLAVGATAVICPADVKPANAKRLSIESVPVDGFPDPIPVAADGFPEYNKTHIIADRLNGAAISENLFTGYRLMNTSGMLRCEYAMVRVLRRGEVLTYTGTVRYNPGDKKPTGIHMSASTEQSGKVFSLFIENKNERFTSCGVED